MRKFEVTVTYRPTISKIFYVEAEDVQDAEDEAYAAAIKEDRTNPDAGWIDDGDGEALPEASEIRAFPALARVLKVEYETKEEI